MGLKSLLMCLCVGYGCLCLSAQSVSGLGAFRSSPNDTIAFEILDKAIYRAYYKLTYVPDSTLIQRKIEGQMLLLVGQKYQEFMDYNMHQKDSVFNVQTKAGRGTVAIASALSLGRKAVDAKYLIKNYPEQGATTFQNEFLSRNPLRYTDNHGAIAWTLHKDSKEVQGYKVLKATCDYRGRTYTAWYTPDIPISSGPYVFGGLPGLIVQIEDSKGHYRYELNGLYQVDQYDPIYLPSNKVVKTTREAVRKMYQNLADNPSLRLKGLSGNVKVPPAVQERISKPRPYNPIELE